MKKHLFSLFLLFFAITVSAQEISRELIKMAKKGDVEAQLTLGKSYIENSQSNKAARWLYNAAKNGNKEAEKLLFSFYSKEFEKYAKEGNVDAQFNLGNIIWRTKRLKRQRNGSMPPPRMGTRKPSSCCSRSTARNSKNMPKRAT